MGVDALALEHGFPSDDGPWAGRGDTSSDPPEVEFIYYDDLGIDDAKDFGASSLSVRVCECICTYACASLQQTRLFNSNSNGTLFTA